VLGDARVASEGLSFAGVSSLSEGVNSDNVPMRLLKNETESKRERRKQ
jgi:hypothetical protein